MRKKLDTAKQFARHTPQPPEGFFPLARYTPFSFHPTGIATTAYREENLHPGVVGLVVNSLIRYLLSGDKQKCFHYAYRNRPVGAHAYNGKERKSVNILLNEIDGLNTQSVLAARQLAAHVSTSSRRPGEAPPIGNTPDAYTIEQIISMVEDTVAFFQKQTVQSAFATFSLTDQFRIITGNEHSFVADNTLWKTHVSFREPDKKDTLRLMTTAILAQAKNGVTRAGLINIRLRKAYVCDLNDPNFVAQLNHITELMKWPTQSETV